jgi:hypothetical protein
MMIRIPGLAAGLVASWPTLALAEEVSATYRGIGSIYFTFIGAILIYGVYDSFGKTGRVCRRATHCDRVIRDASL